MKTLKKNLLLILMSILFIGCCFLAFLPMMKVDAKTVTVRTEQKDKVELYQLAPENKSLMESYVIKTENGKIVVIDGGIDETELGLLEDSAPYLPSAIRAILGLEDDAYFEVDAWFISHAHGDHYRELKKMLNNYTAQGDNNYKIKNFYFDFPSNFDRYPEGDMSPALLEEFKAGLQIYATANGIETEDYYNDLNGAVINKTAIDEGLIITVDGVDFEILQTYSDDDAIVNSNSTIIRVWVDGQSVLFLNDCYEDSGDRLIATYGNKLKSDIVQMAHHGQSGCKQNVYDIVDAKVHLWSAAKWVWDNADGVLQTDEVREWVGAGITSDKYNIVSGLYENYPTDPTSVSDWKDCIEEMKISLPYMYAYDYQFVANTGAGIRLNDGSTGLRFSATLYSYDPESLYGFVIVPKVYLTKNSITDNFIPELIDIYGEDGIIKMYSRVMEEGKHYKIQGSIANVLYDNINIDFVGIPFEEKNGEYTYAHFEGDDVNNVSRSVPEVASNVLNMYLNGDMSDAEKAVIEEKLSVINGFITKSINKQNNVPEANADTPVDVSISFNKASYTTTFGNKIQTELTTNFSSAAIIYSSSNPDITVDKNGVVSCKGLGEATITAKILDKTATCTVKFELTDGYIATFDNSEYEKLVGYVDGLSHPSSLTATYLTSYADVDNVLKVESVENGSYESSFTLSLPKAVNGAVKLKYMIGALKTDGFYLEAGSHTFTEIVPTIGVWQEVYLDYTNVTDNDILTVHIWSNKSKPDASVFYFAYIEEVPTIAEAKQTIAGSLSEGYIAEFNSKDYEVLVANYDASGLGEKYGYAGALYAETVATFQGETNLLKVTTIPNTETMYNQQYAPFKIILPKSATQILKVKYYVDSKCSAGVEIKSGSVLFASTFGAIDTWHEIELDYTQSGVNADEICFNLYAGTGKNEIYFAYITEEKTVEQIKADLASTLKNNYLADFTSEEYCRLVSPYGPSGLGTVETEYLETFEGQTGVLKVSGYPFSSSAWCSGFKIDLPKSSSSTLKVKIWIDTMKAEGRQLEYAGSSVGIGNKTGFWQDVTLANISGESSSIRFDCWKNSAGVVDGADVVIYIASVREVKDTNTIKTALSTNLPSGYVADFTSEDYCDLVSPYGPSGEGKLSVDYLETFEGETGVLKVSGYPFSSSAWCSGFKIDLPKASSSTLKVKLWIDTMKAAGRQLEYSGSSIGIGNTTGCWQEFTLENKNGASSIVRLDAWRNDNANISGADIVIYIAYVKEIRTVEQIKTELATDLEGTNYVADFSNSDYELLVDKWDPDGHGATGYPTQITKEYQSEFAGEKNVIMVTTTANLDNPSRYASFNIYLPKTVSGLIKIRYYIDTNISAGHCFRSGSKTWEFSTAIGDKNRWVDVVLDFSEDGVNNNELGFYLWEGTGTNVYYIAWIKEVKTQEQTKADINDALSGTDYLMDFSDAYYETLIEKWNNDAVTGLTDYNVLPSYLSADYLESFGEEENVLKITTRYNPYNSNKYAPFKVILPKAVTGKIKMRYYVENKPAGAELYSGTVKLGNVAAKGSWTEVELDYSQTGVNPTELAFNMWYGEPDNVIYISWIKVVE